MRQSYACPAGVAKRGGLHHLGCVPVRTDGLLAVPRALALALLLGAAWSAPCASQQLELRFFDVGQADAALVTSPEGRTMLVDAGRGGRTITGYLAELRLDTLDLVVISHNHEDHAGGVADVLRRFTVRNYMDNGAPTTRTLRIYETLQALGVRYLSPTARSISLGSVSVRVIPPPDERLPLADTEREQNNRSVGLLVEYGGFRALFTGDSQAEELGFWLATDSLPSVTVVKVAHHGSHNGTTEPWIAATRPRVAVISVGRNGYGHPSATVVAAWCGAGATVVRTDYAGTIVVRADSTGEFTVRSARATRGACGRP
jgi:beta-lactamase superfamily II metal-dependent hydrolase